MHNDASSASSAKVINWDVWLHPGRADAMCGGSTPNLPKCCSACPAVCPGEVQGLKVSTLLINMTQDVDYFAHIGWNVPQCWCLINKCISYTVQCTKCCFCFLGTLKFQTLMLQLNCCWTKSSLPHVYVELYPSVLIFFFLWCVPLFHNTACSSWSRGLVFIVFLY